MLQLASLGGCLPEAIIQKQIQVNKSGEMRMSTTLQPMEPGSEQRLMPESDIEKREIRIKGKPHVVPSVEIEDRTVVTTGKWIKVASVRDEELVEGETIPDPEKFVNALKRSSLPADLFTFGQRIPDTERKYAYKTEWENAASIPITTFSDWWKNRAEHSIRKCVNRAKKVGVLTKVVELDDELLIGISKIYDEVPVRQGKAFWHYGEDLEAIRRALATYLDRSIFIGAYYEGELIGFMKITWVGRTAPITQILSLRKHFDKRPNNLLIAKAIEICESEGKSHFIYGSFVYYDPNSSLTEFKRRNGFDSIALPRYFIPLTLKGQLAIKLGLHRGIAENIPEPVFRQFLKIRKFWSERKLKSV